MSLGYVARRCRRQELDRRSAAGAARISASARAASRRPTTPSCAARAGTSQVEVNALGRVIRELAREEGTPGQDVVAHPRHRRCSDSSMQRLAAREQRACGRARRRDRRRAGDGLDARASIPTPFNARPHAGEWQELHRPIRATPLINKAIAGALSARLDLQAGGGAGGARRRASSPADTRHLPRLSRRSATRRFHCWQKGGHGTLDLRDAHQAILRRLSSTRSRAAHRHRPHRGDGAAASASAPPLGIDLPGERAGLIPTRDWKLATTGDGLAARRDADRRHRPGLRAGDAAAARGRWRRASPTAAAR